MKTHILYSITFFFFKNCTVYEIMSKNVVETDESQMTPEYGAYALRAGLARLHARMRMHTPTRPGAPMHACTHRPTIDTYCFSTAKIIRKRASMLRYTTLFLLFDWLSRSLTKSVPLEYSAVKICLIIIIIIIISNLSDDRSKSSSKTIPPLSAI